MAAEFRQTTTICIERPVGTGASAEFMGSGTHPFRATVGLRVEPAALDSGVRFRLEIELGSLPFSFVRAVEETVHQTLQQGLCGWQVTDCTVTMTQVRGPAPVRPRPGPDPLSRREYLLQVTRGLPGPAGSGRAAGSPRP